MISTIVMPFILKIKFLFDKFCILPPKNMYALPYLISSYLFFSFFTFIKLGELEKNLTLNTTQPKNIQYDAQKVKNNDESKVTPNGPKPTLSRGMKNGVKGTSPGPGTGGKSTEKVSHNSQPKNSTVTTDILTPPSPLSEEGDGEGQGGGSVSTAQLSTIHASVLTDTVEGKNSASAMQESRSSIGIGLSSSALAQALAANTLCNYSSTRHTLKSKCMLKRNATGSSVQSNPLFTRKSSPDLSIFRSPLARQKYQNVNQYSARDSAWIPTKLTGKYNSRFQYTTDISDAKKVNQMMNT
jgi:hypothetical protein